jgi:glycosyltransferase involved in cell wall biosynthesis
MRVSFVIPVYNEAESLRELHAEILAAVNALPGNVHRERRAMYETPLSPPPLHDDAPRAPAKQEAPSPPAADDVYRLASSSAPPPAPVSAAPRTETGENAHVDAEIIFIDDGSTDTSWSVIRRLAELNDNTSGIRFRRNFGKAAALAAGFQAMTGDVVMTLDADLQDDPAELPNFLNKLGSRYDVVNGWKERRLDPWHKVYPSKVFNWLVGLLTGLKLHDHNCGLKVLRADVARDLRLYGELHRFIPVLAHARGYRVAELAVQHRPRQYGQSKYGFKRFARGFLDLLTSTFSVGSA